jgi:hypothetical protein
LFVAGRILEVVGAEPAVKELTAVDGWAFDFGGGNVGGI